MNHEYREQEAFHKCVKCKTIGVVWGGLKPEWTPVEKDVCISCVADLVGRDKAMTSYRRMHPRQKEVRKSRNKRGKRPGVPAPA